MLKKGLKRRETEGKAGTEQQGSDEVEAEDVDEERVNADKRSSPKRSRERVDSTKVGKATSLLSGEGSISTKRTVDSRNYKKLN
jgi:hypothetical protein